MVTAHRYPGSEARERGIVGELAPEGEVLDRAVELAASLVGKPRRGIGEIKRGLYASVIDTLLPAR
jgi:enoyl-CoA hydratase/carnithine racemase